MSAYNSTRRKRNASRVRRVSQEYEVDFGSKDVKQIFQYLSYSIISRLDDPEINSKILTLINSMGILDQVELLPLIENTSKATELKRMIGFINRFLNKDEEKIMRLLKTLCNLDDGMKNVSKDIRKIINTEFRGSVRSGNEGLRSLPKRNKGFKVDANDKENFPVCINGKISRSKSSLGLSGKSLSIVKEYSHTNSRKTCRKIPETIKNIINSGCLTDASRSSRSSQNSVANIPNDSNHLHRCDTCSVEMESDDNSSVYTTFLEKKEMGVLEPGVEQPKSCLGFCKKHLIKVVVVAGVAATACVACIHFLFQARPDETGNVYSTTSDDFATTTYFIPTYLPFDVRTVASNNELFGNETFISSFLK